MRGSIEGQNKELIDLLVQPGPESTSAPAYVTGVVLMSRRPSQSWIYRRFAGGVRQRLALPAFQRAAPAASLSKHSAEIGRLRSAKYSRLNYSSCFCFSLLGLCILSALFDC